MMKILAIVFRNYTRRARIANASGPVTSTGLTYTEND
jgi:hypothetical protein